jgi:hypothetical protein
MRPACNFRYSGRFAVTNTGSQKNWRLSVAESIPYWGVVTVTLPGDIWHSSVANSMLPAQPLSNQP